MIPPHIQVEWHKDEEIEPQAPINIDFRIFNPWLDRTIDVSENHPHNSEEIKPTDFWKNPVKVSFEVGSSEFKPRTLNFIFPFSGKAANIMFGICAWFWWL